MLRYNNSPLYFGLGRNDGRNEREAMVSSYLGARWEIPRVEIPKMVADN